MSGAACQASIAALHECKQKLWLHPRQCYPPEYKGECDACEFGLKKCLAFSTSPKDAALLYDTSTSRGTRVEANKRLQKRLKQFNEPCTP